MISIVTSYFQRQELWDRTLSTICDSRFNEWEIIIVDDASVPPLVCDDPRVKVIRIDPKDKWYHNPCIPYNIGFKEAKGDIIIIQNPECMHMGDVLEYASKNVKENSYIAFGCYAINKDETDALSVGRELFIGDYVFTTVTGNGWYNHPTHRPVGYHFCSAITRKDLKKVGGFDERYANGVAFDDDAFIRSIKRLNIKVSIPIEPFVVHQFHTHFTYDDSKVWRPLHAINCDLYNRT